MGLLWFMFALFVIWCGVFVLVLRVVWFYCDLRFCVSLWDSVCFMFGVYWSLIV